LSRLLGGKPRLKSLGHYFVGLRNLDEPSASLGVVHFSGMRATFLRPVTVFPDFIPVDLVACTHWAYLLLSYMKYYNETRTHLSLKKDAPIPRAIQAAGRILCLPILGGLHHHYARI